jgi:hypothetical protein
MTHQISKAPPSHPEFYLARLCFQNAKKCKCTPPRFNQLTRHPYHIIAIKLANKIDINVTIEDGWTLLAKLPAVICATPLELVLLALVDVALFTLEVVTPTGTELELMLVEVETTELELEELEVLFEEVVKTPNAVEAEETDEVDEEVDEEGVEEVDEAEVDGVEVVDGVEAGADVGVLELEEAVDPGVADVVKDIILGATLAMELELDVVLAGTGEDVVVVL